MLPNRFSLPAAFVVNLSPHGSRGSHWIALHIDTKKNAEYFDSFGFGPTQGNILHFIKTHSKRLQFNRKQFQHIISNKCGKFAILFILCKMYDKNVNDVFEKFSSNLSINDLVIENLFNYFRELRKSIILSRE